MLFTHLCIGSMIVRRPVFHSGTLDVEELQRGRFMGLIPNNIYSAAFFGNGSVLEAQTKLHLACRACADWVGGEWRGNLAECYRRCVTHGLYSRS
jgi:hypothetical protein